MPLKFHDLDDKLVITDGDASAVWSDDHRQWIIGDVALARRAMTDGQLITREAAAHDWPDANLRALPLGE